MLSSVFIKSPEYGTRSSTLLTVDNNSNVTFTERTYGTHQSEDMVFRFKIL